MDTNIDFDHAANNAARVEARHVAHDLWMGGLVGAELVEAIRDSSRSASGKDEYLCAALWELADAEEAMQEDQEAQSAT